MSAYLVDERHISTLLKNYNDLFHKAKLSGFDKEQLSKKAEMLARANIDSVNYRYTGNFWGNDAIQYIMNVKKLVLQDDYEPLELIELINMIDCLDYQSMEIPNYKNSESCKFLIEMKEFIINRIIRDWNNKNPEKVQWSYSK